MIDSILVQFGFKRTVIFKMKSNVYDNMVVVKTDHVKASNRKRQQVAKLDIFL